MTPSDRLRELADILDNNAARARDGLSVVAARLMGTMIADAADREVRRQLDIAKKVGIVVHLDKPKGGGE